MKQNTTIYDAVFASPIGPLGIVLEGDVLVEVDFLPRGSRLHSARNMRTRAVVKQMQDYFENPRRKFSLPMKLKGTSFQQKVWHAMQKIPAGKVMTYGEMAKKLGSSPRAVGGACRANPIPLIVPCHRVVSASGLGGFAGHTQGRHVRIKRQLLAHEGYTAKA